MLVKDEAPLERAPTLYAIIVFKLGKGLLACLLGLGLYFQPAAHLPVEYQNLLASPAVQRLFLYLRIHPENKFFIHFAQQIGNLTDARVRATAIGALLWSLFPLAEGFGLIFRVKWAGWLAIGESAFFVPVELYKLMEDFSWFMIAVTFSNVLVVWYLYANRERLFLHPQHVPVSSTK
jgi:uncharacterized membrane protein (DUF2068 family)